MKKYICPKTSCFQLQLQKMVAFSVLNSGERVTTTLSDKDATNPAMTREHRGFGGGLWEDMD